MSKRSSVGFHRPKSFVMCRGCLLFFTLLVMGAGFTTMVRGGVRVPPDFVTCVTWTHKISIKTMIRVVWIIFTLFSLVYLLLLGRCRVAPWAANWLYNRRAFDSTGRLDEAALHQLIIKLFPLYRPNARKNYVFVPKMFPYKKEKKKKSRLNLNLEELLRLGTPLPKAWAAVLFTSFTPSDSSSSDRLWAPATPIGDPTTGSPACICPDTSNQSTVHYDSVV